MLAGSHLSLRTWQGLVRKVRDKLGNMEELVKSPAKAVALLFYTFFFFKHFECFCHFLTFFDPLERTRGGACTTLSRYVKHVKLGAK
jgi:hypothetical protein